MFIIKAMKASATSFSEEYVVWQCDHYSVAPYNVQSSSSDKNYVRPQKELMLYEASEPLQPSKHLCTLYVGLAEQQGQFDSVYVMNERGKTVDTIQARDG